MSYLHFTLSTPATAKLEPRGSVTNQSNVVIILGCMGLGYGLGYSLGYVQLRPDVAHDIPNSKVGD